MPATCLFLYACWFLDNSQNTESSFAEFGDLGNLLLGGFATAVLVAITFTFVRLRLRAKKPPPAQFISISAAKQTSIDYTDSSHKL